MPKISRKELEARMVHPKIPREERAAVIERATSRVKTTARIDFCREIRHHY